MSLRTAVHLLRHGEVHNPRNVLYGRLPGYHLSPLGQEMARRVAEHLVGGRFDIVEIVSSPLERARETAAPLAEALQLPVRIDERLIEASNGFQGKQFGVGDGSLRHPATWRLLWNPFRPSWGEPYEQAAARVLAAVDDVRSRVAGHEAVLVAHQLPIWVARRRAAGQRLWHDPRHRQCNLASLTSLHFDDDRLVSIGYSEPAADLLPGASKVSGA